MSMDEHYLGVDYGEARVGLALSFGSLAEPLETLKKTPRILEEIQKICVDNRVTAIVVGQSEREMAAKSKVFAQELSDYTGLPFHLQDETLSSVEVTKRLRVTRVGKKQYTGPIDHFAAALILERYLEEVL